MFPLSIMKGLPPGNNSLTKKELKLNIPLTPIKSDEDRLSDKIDGLVRTLYYKNKQDVIDQLCLLKGRLYLAKRMKEKERKAEVLSVEKAISELQMAAL